MLSLWHWWNGDGRTPDLVTPSGCPRGDRKVPQNSPDQSSIPQPQSSENSLGSLSLLHMARFYSLPKSLFPEHSLLPLLPHPTNSDTFFSSLGLLTPEHTLSTKLSPCLALGKYINDDWWVNKQLRCPAQSSHSNRDGSPAWSTHLGHCSFRGRRRETELLPLF